MSLKALAVVMVTAMSMAVMGQPAGPSGGSSGQNAQAAGANQNSSKDNQAGEAIVVTRDGPSIALENNVMPIIAVAFPMQQGQGQAQPSAAQSKGEEGIEISALIANPNDVAKPKEILFESGDAANGMVVYSGNEAGGAQLASAQQAPSQPGQPGQANAKEKQTQLIFSARCNGKVAKVTELANQGNARILVVKHEDQTQAKPGQPAKAGQAQPAAAQQPGQAGKQKAQTEQNDAVIFVYLRGEQAK